MRQKDEHQVYEDPFLGELVIFFEYNDFGSETYMFGHFMKLPGISAVIACGYEVTEDCYKQMIQKLYTELSIIKKILAPWEAPYEKLARMDKKDNL